MLTINLRKEYFSFLIIISLLFSCHEALAQTDFDPYAASDAQGHYLNPPLIYPAPRAPEAQMASPVGETQFATPVAEARPVPTPMPAPVQYTNQRTYKTAPGPFAPIADRILSDPTFLPLKGQVFGGTDYSYTNYEGNRTNNVGVRAYSFDKRTNAGIQNLSYGVTDELSVNFAMQYDSSISKDRYPTGANFKFDNTGFSDPTFGVAYRAIDERTNPVNFDLRASYTPDAIGSKSSTTIDGGNIARGGQSGELEMALSREMKAVTIEGYSGINLLDDRKTVNSSTGLTAETSGSLVYFVGANTQTRITDRVSFNLGLTDNFYSRSHFTNDAAGTSYSLEPYSVLEPNVALNFHIIPNQLVSSVEYNHYFIGREKDVNGTPITEDGAYNDQDEDQILVRLRYLFF